MTDAALATPENAHRWARNDYDHYVEPEWCSQRLFAVETFEGAIWDPACGFGRIPRAAATAGYEALGTDIVNRGCVITRDFLQDQPANAVGNIVSNPPFDVFEQFAGQALKVARNKVALIWLVRRLNAAHWLRDTPLARVLLLTPRPSMPPGHLIAAGDKPGGGKQDFCWLVWDHAHTGPATLDWLRRDP